MNSGPPRSRFPLSQSLRKESFRDALPFGWTSRRQLLSRCITAALGTLVLLANEQERSRRALHATIDAERARGDRLFAKNERLQTDLEQVKLEYIKSVRAL